MRRAGARLSVGAVIAAPLASCAAGRLTGDAAGAGTVHGTASPVIRTAHGHTGARSARVAPGGSLGLVIEPASGDTRSRR